MDTTTLPSGTRRPPRRGKLGIVAAAGSVLLGAGAGLSACSNNPSSPATTTSPTVMTTGASGAAALKTESTAALGTILVTPSGATVYRFDADSASPPTSHCTGSCSSVWPPVPAGAGSPQAQGFAQSELGSITRPDGTKQLTVSGWPVYTYTGDTAAGQTNGQHLNVNGGTWWAVTTSGARASASPGAPSASATGGGVY
jgi:predicted lipoprotein with Yx(FWY)xxD motif